MDMHTATEQAYKNGYQKAYDEMRKKVDIESCRADEAEEELIDIEKKLKYMSLDMEQMRLKIRDRDLLIERLRGTEQAFERLLELVASAFGTDARERMYKHVFGTDGKGGK